MHHEYSMYRTSSHELHNKGSKGVLLGVPHATHKRQSCPVPGHTGSVGTRSCPHIAQTGVPRVQTLHPVKCHTRSVGQRVVRRCEDVCLHCAGRCTPSRPCSSFQKRARSCHPQSPRGRWGSLVARHR